MRDDAEASWKRCGSCSAYYSKLCEVEQTTWKCCICASSNSSPYLLDGRGRRSSASSEKEMWQEVVAIEVQDWVVSDARSGSESKNAGRQLFVVAVDLSLCGLLAQDMQDKIARSLGSFPAESLVAVMAFTPSQLYVYDLSFAECVCVKKLLRSSDTDCDWDILTAIDFRSLALHVGTIKWKEKISKAVRHACSSQVAEKTAQLTRFVAALTRMVKRKKKSICGTSLFLFGRPELFLTKDDVLIEDFVRNSIRLVAFVYGDVQQVALRKGEKPNKLALSKLVVATCGDLFLLGKGSDVGADVEWALAQRPAAVDCLIRVRKSKGLDKSSLDMPVNFLDEYVDIGSLPALLVDSSLTFEFKYDLLDGPATIQIALLYSRPKFMQRRLRLFTAQIGATSDLDILYRSAHLESTCFLVLRRTLRDIFTSGVDEARLRLAEWLVFSASGYSAFDIRKRSGSAEFKNKDLTLTFSENLAGLTRAMLTLCNSPALQTELDNDTLNLVIVLLWKAVPCSAELVSAGTPHSREQFILYEQLLATQADTEGSLSFAAFHEEVLNMLADKGIKLNGSYWSSSSFDSASKRV